MFSLRMIFSWIFGFSPFLINLSLDERANLHLFSLRVAYYGRKASKFVLIFSLASINFSSYFLSWILKYWDSLLVFLFKNRKADCMIYCVSSDSKRWWGKELAYDYFFPGNATTTMHTFQVWLSIQLLN